MTTNIINDMMQPSEGIAMNKNNQHLKENTTKHQPGRFATFWERVRQLGISKTITRIGTSVMTILVAAVAVYALGRFYLDNVNDTPAAALLPTEETNMDVGMVTSVDDIILPAYSVPDTAYFYGTTGIAREALPNTEIPARARTDVTSYEVLPGESVFTIADKFSLEPETILWGNYETLHDNPRVIDVGQILTILPTNGIYYQFHTGETLTSIAQNFGVTVEDIIEYPGNNLDPYEIDPENPAIPDGTWIIIPGGTRELEDWGPPAISRENPAVAQYYGPGSCGAVYSGPVGDGIFSWPAVSTFISGYHYDPGIHEAIDIGGVEGSPIYAADSGVVVYSGGSNYGYGNLVVIDHGNGWQTAYAHLLYSSVTCGQSVYRGDTIGALGSTGNSTGPHLHFEMNSSIYGKVNPLDYLIGG
ncbi:peptidoglycan DD-metalloendopeptidase family protein [bacterium]|nr:peptidoglycan DD-metalloendopeptidase family protein [bacterium]